MRILVLQRAIQCQSKAKGGAEELGLASTQKSRTLTRLQGQGNSQGSWSRSHLRCSESGLILRDQSSVTLSSRLRSDVGQTTEHTIPWFLPRWNGSQGRVWALGSMYVCSRTPREGLTLAQDTPQQEHPGVDLSAATPMLLSTSLGPAVPGGGSRQQWASPHWSYVWKGSIGYSGRLSGRLPPGAGQRQKRISCQGFLGPPVLFK